MSTVVRADREALRAAMEDFLAGRCDNHAYDERIQTIRDRSADPAVVWTVDQLWYFYCDFRTHRAELGKLAWDYHQRLLLLLASEAQIEEPEARAAHASQAVAALLLLGLAAAWWWPLPWAWALHVPAAGAAWLLARWRSRASARLLPAEPDGPDEAFPFPSRGALLRVRRLLPGFRKAPHPPALAQAEQARQAPGLLARLDRAGDRALGCAWGGILAVVLIAAAPLWLLTQCRPVRATRWRLAVPQA